MDHFVRMKYSRKKRKSLKSLRLGRSGRLSDLGEDNKIPAYVLPLEGENSSKQIKKKHFNRKANPLCLINHNENFLQ